MSCPLAPEFAAICHESTELHFADIDDQLETVRAKAREVAEIRTAASLSGSDGSSSQSSRRSSFSGQDHSVRARISNFILIWFIFLPYTKNLTGAPRGSQGIPPHQVHIIIIMIIIIIIIIIGQWSQPHLGHLIIIIIFISQ